MPKVEVQVSGTKDDSKGEHNKMQECIDGATTAIYTDGSGIEGKIDAAAYNTTTDRVSHLHLGSEKQYNVFTGELAAMQLAVEMLRGDWHDTCRIYSDSQAAVKAIDRPRRQSGQAVIKEILDSIDEVIHEYRSFES